jgi:hypothetical protein
MIYHSLVMKGEIGEKGVRSQKQKKETAKSYVVYSHLIIST